jgi:hypothetical protein
VEEAPHQWSQDIAILGFRSLTSALYPAQSIF